MVLNGQYERFPKMTESDVSHVRPHGRDSKDLTPGIDGQMHKKYCFWLNADYITRIATNSMRDN